MITPIVALIVSIFLVYLFIVRVINLWLDVMTFWNRVAYRQRNGDKFDIEYSFTFGTFTIVAGICGFAGLLWSVIKLAMIA